MIKRYEVKEIAKIWSDENKYNVWLKVEQLVCEAWAELGYIDKTDIDKINKNLKVDLNRMLEIEAETKAELQKQGKLCLFPLIV